MDFETEVWHYDEMTVGLIIDIEDATGRVILNPFDIETTSVEMVDYGLIADKAQYRKRVEFEEGRMRFKDKFGV